MLKNKKSIAFVVALGIYHTVEYSRREETVIVTVHSCKYFSKIKPFSAHLL